MYQGARNVQRSEGTRGVTLRRVPAIVAFVLLPACGQDADDTVRLEVFSWWNRPSEAQAFEAVAEFHQSTHPGVVVDNRADPMAVDQRARMARLMLSRAPPATFTANIGADLLRWATIDREDGGRDYSYVKDVSALLERTGLREALPPELRAALSVGDSPELYGVPINVHRLKLLYYNVDEVERLREERPDVDLLSFDTLCPESGAPDLPEGLKIAIGPEAFALILLTFESVLPAIAGPAFYDALFRGEAPESVTVPGESYHTDVRRALACVHALSAYFVPPPPPPPPGETPADFFWWTLLDDVRTGDATFTVMGDWANGELATELENGDVKAIPFPGTEGTFVFTSDTFPLPIGAESELAVVSLLETIASPPAQERFSAIKGSIPAWRDVNDPAFSTASRTDFDDVSIQKVLATSGRFPPYYVQADLGKALGDLTAVGAAEDTIDAALVQFDSQEPLLRRFQDRLRRGSEPPRP
jgi:glucose/mannose transport system substrate-binding protein